MYAGRNGTRVDRGAYSCRISRGKGAGRIGGRRRVMTPEIVERSRRMLENGATRQQVADVIGVGAKAVYKYFPANS